MRRILSRGAEEIRQLTGDDLAQIKRLLQTSEYVYQRFTPEELPTLLAHYPALCAFYGSSLHGFILSQTVNAPSAWVGGFSVSWTDSQSDLKILDALLEQLTPRFIKITRRYL